MSSFSPIRQLMCLVAILSQVESRICSSCFIVGRPNHPHVGRPNHPHLGKPLNPQRYLSSDTNIENESTDQLQRRRHVVDGISCREVSVELPLVGHISILEATVESQQELVDMALLLEGEEDERLEQKLNAADPYGTVLWPAALTVANYLLTTLTILKDKGASSSILELGTGTGLVSIAACMGGADKVLATDYEDLALKFTSYAAKHLNGCHNLETALLDMTDNTPLPQADIVVAADIMYEVQTGRALARRAVEALRQGSRVIVGDSPGRAGRPAFLKELQELGVEGATFVDIIGRTCTGPRNELICGKGSLSISETPIELPIAIMDLDPSILMKKVSKK